jgi:hypothetical protein
MMLLDISWKLRSFELDAGASAAGVAGAVPAGGAAAAFTRPWATIERAGAFGLPLSDVVEDLGSACAWATVVAAGQAGVFGAGSE